MPPTYRQLYRRATSKFHFDTRLIFYEYYGKYKLKHFVRTSIQSRTPNIPQSHAYPIENIVEKNTRNDLAERKIRRRLTRNSLSRLIYDVFTNQSHDAPGQHWRTDCIAIYSPHSQINRHLVTRHLVSSDRLNYRKIPASLSRRLLTFFLLALSISKENYQTSIPARRR